MSVTRKRDLHTGKPVWAAHPHPRLESTRLRRSRRADVVVVGAGITGSMVAHALTEARLKPLTLDRRRDALRGSTAASTALLQFELDTPLTQLSRKVGKRNAEQAWRCSQAAVNELRTRAHDLRISAQLHTRPSLYLAGDLLDAAGLRREVRARQRIGMPSELLERKALRHHFKIDRTAAILSHGNAEADPVSLAAGFLARAIHLGARLHAPHEVTDLHANARGVTLFTRDGIEIQARRVVLCTGYELPKIVPTRGHRIEHVGDRDLASARENLAAASASVGGVGTLPLRARDDRWGSDLRRRGRGVLGREASRCGHSEEDRATPEEALATPAGYRSARCIQVDGVLRLH